MTGPSDIDERLGELAEYIKGRAKASITIASTVSDREQGIRCAGKAAAYRHAAELVAALRSDLAAEQRPSPDEAESLWNGPELVDGDEALAVRWVAGTIPDDEREPARARLVASGRVLGEDGRWRKVGPVPVAGEIVAKRGGR